jgi:hypothetical protein
MASGVASSAARIPTRLGALPSGIRPAGAGAALGAAGRTPSAARASSTSTLRGPSGPASSSSTSRTASRRADAHHLEPPAKWPGRPSSI